MPAKQQGKSRETRFRRGISAAALLRGVRLRGSLSAFLGSWALTMLSTLSVGMLTGRTVAAHLAAEHDPVKTDVRFPRDQRSCFKSNSYILNSVQPVSS